MDENELHNQRTGCNNADSLTCIENRRKLSRRAQDQDSNRLTGTVASLSCRACLENMGNASLLLDSNLHVIYANPAMLQIAGRQDIPFTLTPVFAPHDASHVRRVSDFCSGRGHNDGPLSLFMENKDGQSPLLLTVFRLPQPSESDSHEAYYMLILRDSRYAHQKQWKVFIEQFRLTQSEARVCRALADGLTSKDYCQQWNVAATTFRSQLNSVFVKTSTRRQSDLLRLIFLFIQT